MTLAEKLTKALTEAQAEVDRIEASYRRDLPAALERVKVLRRFERQLVPELEDAFAQVKALGITLDE